MGQEYHVLILKTGEAEVWMSKSKRFFLMKYNCTPADHKVIKLRFLNYFFFFFF